MSDPHRTDDLEAQLILTLRELRQRGIDIRLYKGAIALEYPPALHVWLVVEHRPWGGPVVFRAGFPMEDPRHALAWTLDRVHRRYRGAWPVELEERRATAAAVARDRPAFALRAATGASSQALRPSARTSEEPRPRAA